MSRKLLQIFTYILALVPTITGVLNMMGIYDPIFKELNLPNSPVLDSDLRFLGGVWLGLGICVLYITHSLEKHVFLYRVLWSMIFIGGIGRLISMFQVGMPPAPFIAFTALEIIGAPVFLYWHARVFKST